MNRRTEMARYLLTAAAARLLSRRLTPAEHERVRRILVVHLRHLGDVLMAMPALGALRRALPHAAVTFLGGPWATPILADSPLIDEVLTLDSPAFARQPGRKADLAYWRRCHALLADQRPDLIIDFSSDFPVFAKLTTLCAKYWHDFGATRLHNRLNGRHDLGRHYVVRYLDVLTDAGIDCPEPAISLDLLPERRFVGERMLAQAGLDRRPFVLVAPFTTLPHWSVECFGALADRLYGAHDWIPVLTGLAPFAEQARIMAAAMRSPAVNLVGRTTLDDLAAISRRAAAFVGGDGGAAHLAAAVNVPYMVVIFGTTDERVFAPFRDWRHPGQSDGRSLFLRAGAATTPEAVFQAMAARTS